MLQFGVERVASGELWSEGLQGLGRSCVARGDVFADIQNNRRFTLMAAKTQRLTKAQTEIQSVLKQFGPLPDHALVPLAQHVVGAHQSSSGIRTRRAELTDMGFVMPTGDTVVTASGRRALVWRAK